MHPLTVAVTCWFFWLNANHFTVCNGVYTSTVYPGLQTSNGDSFGWNESTLWTEWGVYRENSRSERLQSIYNVTSTKLSANWWIVGWFKKEETISRKMFIDIDNTNDNAITQYNLVVNFTLLVGCTWEDNINDNIKVW